MNHKNLKKKARHEKERFDKIFERLMDCKEFDIAMYEDLCIKLESLQKTINQMEQNACEEKNKDYI